MVDFFALFVFVIIIHGYWKIHDLSVVCQCFDFCIFGNSAYDCVHNVWFVLLMILLIMIDYINNWNLRVNWFGIEDTRLFFLFTFTKLQKHNFLLFFLLIFFPLMSKNVCILNWFVQLRFRLFLCRWRYDSIFHTKPGSVPFRKNRNPESGLKSFCSKSLGVSGKIVGAKWREFF